jgi:hypothetical protein
MAGELLAEYGRLEHQFPDPTGHPSAVQAGRTAEAERLRDVARPFLRVWADQTVPAEPPTQDTFFQERHYNLPQEILEAQQEAWRTARQLVDKRIQEL